METIAGILALHGDEADGALKVDRVHGLVAYRQRRFSRLEVFETDVTRLAGLVLVFLKNLVFLISDSLLDYLRDTLLQPRSDSRFDARLNHRVSHHLLVQRSELNLHCRHVPLDGGHVCLHFEHFFLRVPRTAKRFLCCLVGLTRAPACHHCVLGLDVRLQLFDKASPWVIEAAIRELIETGGYNSFPG